MRRASLLVFCVLGFPLLCGACAGTAAARLQKEEAAREAERSRRLALFPALDAALADAGRAQAQLDVDIANITKPFELPGALTVIGSLDIDGYRCAAYAILPPQPKASVIVVHGYMASAEGFAHIVRSAAARGFAAFAIDLPGHGLSEGRPGEVDSFASYGAAALALAGLCKDQLSLPVLGLGHSMGSLALFDAAARSRGKSPGAAASFSCFDGLVLITPLTKTRYWTPSTIGYHLIRPFSDSISDRYGGRWSLSWFGGLMAWRREADLFKSLDVPAYIILGGEDEVVNNSDAKKFFARKLPRSEIVMFSWMAHHDIEASPTDPRLEALMLRYLEELCVHR